nr:uncharacterized protein LOC123002923 [Drosophila takahashii]
MASRGKWDRSSSQADGTRCINNIISDEIILSYSPEGCYSCTSKSHWPGESCRASGEDAEMCKKYPCAKTELTKTPEAMTNVPKTLKVTVVGKNLLILCKSMKIIYQK